MFNQHPFTKPSQDLPCRTGLPGPNEHVSVLCLRCKLFQFIFCFFFPRGAAAAAAPVDWGSSLRLWIDLDKLVWAGLQVTETTSAANHVTLISLTLQVRQHCQVPSFCLDWLQLEESSEYVACSSGGGQAAAMHLQQDSSRSLSPFNPTTDESSSAPGTIHANPPEGPTAAPQAACI